MKSLRPYRQLHKSLHTAQPLALPPASQLVGPSIQRCVHAPQCSKHQHLCSYQQQRSQCFHTTPRSRLATPLPHPPAPGPPPKAPLPSDTPTSSSSNNTGETSQDRLNRKKNQAALLERGRKLRESSQPTSQPTSQNSSSNNSKRSTALQKRFWKDVNVKQTELGTYEVYLDQRPVRLPQTTSAASSISSSTTALKQPLTLPPSKPHLATAIALEWDNLVSAQQATKNHYIPLTALTSRALDIANNDAEGNTSVRENIITTLMRYLSTDTLLCWAPEKDSDTNPLLRSPENNTQTTPTDQAQEETKQDPPTLRTQQEQTANPIITHLKSHIFPGINIKPALEDGSIMSKPQDPQTMHIIEGWLSGLPAWELAGIERACLATKSLLIAIRLVVEWSGEWVSSRPWENFGGKSGVVEEEKRRFGVDDAAEACTVEVRWQTRMWGEVEDTHDVEREDLKRQLGSVVLLVSDVGR